MIERHDSSFVSPPPPPPPPLGGPTTSSTRLYGYEDRSRNRSTSPRGDTRGPRHDRFRDDHRRDDRRDDHYLDHRRSAYHDDHDYYSYATPVPSSRYERRRDRSPGRYDDRYNRYNDRYIDRYDDRRDDRYDDRRHRSYYQPQRPRYRKTVDRGSEDDRNNSSTLFVGNLPYNFRERDVADMFERCGRLQKVTVPIDSVTSKNKGFAFVEFESRSEAEDAFHKYQGFDVSGRRIKLDWDIGLAKKDEQRGSRKSLVRSLSPPPPPPPPTRENGTPMRDRSRDRVDHYTAVPSVDSRGYRRHSTDLYRR